MEDHEPFITDPEHLRSAAGKSWLVLRPCPDMVRAFDDVQERVKELVEDDDGVSFPRPHISIDGFKREANQVIEDLCSRWAIATAAVEVSVEGISWFGPEEKVVILRIAANDALSTSLVGLRTEAHVASVPVFDEIPAEEWIFHMSVAYCDDVSDARWQELVAGLPSSVTDPGVCTIREAELVTFDGGPERLARRFMLSGEA